MPGSVSFTNPTPVALDSRWSRLGWAEVKQRSHCAAWRYESHHICRLDAVDMRFDCNKSGLESANIRLFCTHVCSWLTYFVPFCHSSLVRVLAHPRAGTNCGVMHRTTKPTTYISRFGFAQTVVITTCKLMLDCT